MKIPDREVVVRLPGGGQLRCGTAKFAGVLGDGARIGMGALVGPGVLVGRGTVLMGATPLQGMPLEIPDLRAGFAYILAGLVATGSSEISGTRYLERGYEDPIGKLRSIGVKIETVLSVN